MGGPHTANICRTVARPNYPYPGSQGPDQIGGPRPLVHQIEDWVEGILPFEFAIGVVSDVELLNPFGWPKNLRPLFAVAVARFASRVSAAIRWRSVWPLFAAVVAALASHAVTAATAITAGETPAAICLILTPRVQPTAVGYGANGPVCATHTLVREACITGDTTGPFCRNVGNIHHG